MPAASEIPKSVEYQKHLTSMHIDAWKRNDVFTIEWWILILLIIVSLIVWWLLVDKARLKEACVFASLALIIVLAVNEYGQELVLWDYPVDIIPIFPPLTSANLLILPLAYSIAYQHFKTTKRFIWVALITTAVICFIIEPLMSWGGLYQLIHWQYYFNYPVYVLIAILARFFTIGIYRITQKSRHGV